MGRLRIALLLVAVFALLVIGGDAASAQCAMCRSALAGSNSAFVRNFNLGVLVLLVPPVTIFCSIFFVLRRNRNSGDGDGA